MNPLCGSCRFFAAQISRISALRPIEGVGECRRNAPRGPLTIGWAGEGNPEHEHRAIISSFPLVPDDDWCGEFSPKQVGGA